jgi:hypothetical protein
MSIESDEELAQRIRQAHAADAPPPFRAVLARATSHPRHPGIRGLALVGVALAGFVLSTRYLGPSACGTEEEIPSVEISTLPLDFLLKAPSAGWLGETPQFDTEGSWP